MIARSNVNKYYIGPKALFDPNYIPPHLLYRKKEEDSLFSILNDSISDAFNLNILYQGINGIGKKVIINKVLNDILVQNKEFTKINKVCVDCKEKNSEELIFSLLNEINNFSNLNFDFRTLLNSEIHQLWNTFKFVCNRIDSHLFFIFNNIEYLEPEIFNKFLQFGKETNITLISTVNKILQPGTIDIFSKFDLKKKLNFFTYQELYSILKQRVLLSFSHEIDRDLIRYIADLICEQFVPVPGKGIEILRELYPILKNRNPHGDFEVLENCQNEFDTYQILDEFSMINYLSGEEVLTVIFLDNLSNYFISKNRYYISLKELYELYEISCESLEYEKTHNEFRKLVEDIFNIGVIKPSKRTFQKKDTKKNFLGVNHDCFFILMNPKQIQIIIDTIFNQC
jgi:Cdc6-like AAA superfamily ATPase